MLQPIETHYKGYRFRSRTEARWAVFFDTMQWWWEYEPEGYKLPNGEMYLPDFRITGSQMEDDRGDVADPFLVEVKPNPPGDIHKPALLAELTSLYIVSGVPNVFTPVWSREHGWKSMELDTTPHLAVMAAHRARF